jgi:hypothetical protein
MNNDKGMFSSTRGEGGERKDKVSIKEFHVIDSFID